MTVNGGTPLDELLAQAGWAKALAQSLARDEDSADELVQRTWVAALRRPPGVAGNPGVPGSPATLRGWIATAMRNFARQDARERERRTERERQAARPERTEGAGPDSVGESLEAQRRLLEALSSLAEPYRGVLHERYFLGRMPREIARRSGAPVKTVKSQLARGLALLRAKLDRDHGGDRSAWMVWVLPLTAKSAMPTALLGAILVDSKLKVAGGLLALLCVLAVGAKLLGDDPGLPAAVPTVSAGPGEVEAPEGAKAQPAPAESSEREAVAKPEKTPLAHPPGAQSWPTAAVRGRVLDLDNRPIGFVRVVWEARDPIQTERLGKLARPEVASDAAGWFEFAKAPGGVNLLVEDPRWVTVYKAYFAQGTSQELTIFVAPRIQLAGAVVDPAGRFVEGAEVELRLASSVKSNLDRRLDSAYRANFLARTDVQGRFSIDAPACAGELRATFAGFEPGTLPAPEHDTSDLVIALRARDKRPAVVSGIVVDEAGTPLADAFVALGASTKRTEKDGRFTFDLDASPGDDFVEKIDGVWRSKYPRNAIRAVRYGYLPREAPVPPVEELRSDVAPRELRLVLARGSFDIRGRVVEADGTPVSDATIVVLDETPFGSILERVGESAVGREASIEQMLRGGLQMGIAESSADGRFLVQGLTQRAYDLAALDGRTLRWAVVRGVQAGRSDARIELPPDTTLRHVAGRVVDHDGKGVPDVTLILQRVTPGSPRGEFGRSLTVDPDGKFDFGDVDPDFLRVQVLGQEIFLIMAWQPPADAPLDDLEIVVSLRAPVKVELSPTSPRADEFSFLDADGKPCDNFCFEGPMMSLPRRCRLDGERSEVYATEDVARTLVLYAEGAEIARVPVRLEAGKMNVLRP